jgi:hypothetical protein
MLTIKVIRPDGKQVTSEISNADFSEFVEEARTVFYNTAAQSVSGHPSVTYFKDDREGKAIDVYEGLVYVMNEGGKTIAKYDLGYGFPKNTVVES